MNSTRNKRLLACFLVAVGLSTNIFNNNEIASAVNINSEDKFKKELKVNIASDNYKRLDRYSLSKLIEEINSLANAPESLSGLINERSKNLDENNLKKYYDIYNHLVGILADIWNERREFYSNSILKHFMGNNAIFGEVFDEGSKIKNLKYDKTFYDEEDLRKLRKKFVEDLAQMQNLVKKVNFIRGGHDTVWEDKVVAAISNLNDKLSNLFDWFKVLGGTNDDIKNYKNYLKEYEKAYNDKFKKIDADLNKKQVFDTSYINYNNKNDKIDIKRKKVLERVLKIYCVKHDGAYVGDKWCELVIDKFVYLKNLDRTKENIIDEDTEAKIYCVFEKILDLFKFNGKCFIIDENQDQRREYIAMVTSGSPFQTSKLEKSLLNAMPSLTRREKILLLDEILSLHDFKKYLVFLLATEVNNVMKVMSANGNSNIKTENENKNGNSNIKTENENEDEYDKLIKRHVRNVSFQNNEQRYSLNYSIPKLK